MAYVLTCAEIGATSPCCPICITKIGYKIMVYPIALHGDHAPDQSMGIKAAVCCHHVHTARDHDRAWWVTEMMRRNKRYNEDDIRTLVAVAAIPDVFYKVWGSLHERVRARETTRKSVARPRNSNCPNCSTPWNQVVCDGCGHTGV